MVRLEEMTVCFLTHQAGVEQLVESRLDKLGGELAAQVVQNQQVAGEVAPGLVPGLPAVVAVPEELPGLELREHVPRCVIHHRMSVLRHSAGDAADRKVLPSPGPLRKRF